MTYDNAGDWTHKTGHHSGFEWSKQGMQFWATTGVPKSKLLMGIPFYGIKFQLQNAAQHGLEAPVTGNSQAITFSQICNSRKREGWTGERSRDGPIAYHGNQWVGYDDPISAAEYYISYFNESILTQTMFCLKKSQMDSRQWFWRCSRLGSWPR